MKFLRRKNNDRHDSAGARDTTAVKLNQFRLVRGGDVPHGRAMDEVTKPPRNPLVIAVFCAIIVLIGYAGFMY